MATWYVQTWVRDVKRPLSKSEKSLLAGALARIHAVLGLCECGNVPAPIGNRDRCEDCWSKQCR
jgi:hypothetical protein